MLLLKGKKFHFSWANFKYQLYYLIKGEDIMTKLSRTRKKPKGHGKGKSDSDPRDAVAKTGPGLGERTASLILKRVEASNGKMPYFRVDICASVLGAQYPDVDAAFGTMLGIGAIEKARRGSYAPTPKCEAVCAAYINEQVRAREAALHGGNGGNGDRYRRRHR